MSHILGVSNLIDIYRISACVTVLKLKNIRPTKNVLKLLYKNYVEKINIHPLRTHTNYIPHSYLHNYSYIHFFYANLTTFLNLLLSTTHKNFKTPYFGNIHTTTSHRDTKNIHTDFYIHDYNTLFTFLRQQVKLHLILNNLSQKNTIPTIIKNKNISIGSVHIKCSYQIH